MSTISTAILLILLFYLFKLNLKGIKTKSDERRKLRRTPPPHRGAQTREKRHHPGPLLYEARSAGRGRFPGRFARPLGPGPTGRGTDHPLRRGALHGRDRQGPLPRQEGAHSVPRGGLLAGRVVRRKGVRRLQGEIPRIQGRVVCQYDGRGQGPDGCLLHVVQCAEGRRVAACRPAADLRPGPQPGILYPEVDWTEEHGAVGRCLPCPRGVFAGKDPAAQTRTPRSEGGRTPRVPGLYR